MELVSLKNVSLDSKVKLLKELGFDSDGEFVLDKQGNKVLDKYLEIPIRVSRMLILPGSNIILDDSELSLSKYIEEYGDIF